MPYADGLTFGAAPLKVRVMQTESRYPWVSAQVGRAWQVLPLDVSFGNVITPAPVTLDFPRLLVPEAVRVSVYPLKTVVAENFAALTELGLLTTQTKDVYDLSIISAREALTWNSLHAVVGRSAHGDSCPDREEAPGGAPHADEPSTRSRSAQWPSAVHRNHAAGGEGQVGGGGEHRAGHLLRAGDAAQRGQGGLSLYQLGGHALGILAVHPAR